jgi:hypothetical protein
MVKHRSHKATHEPPEEARTHGAAGDANGTSSAAGNGDAPADAGHSSEERVRRAEEMVDRMAERIGYAAGRLGHGILWLASRAREEAEDMWAEARSLSRGERGAAGPPDSAEP